MIKAEAVSMKFIFNYISKILSNYVEDESMILTLSLCIFSLLCFPVLFLILNRAPSLSF